MHGAVGLRVDHRGGGVGAMPSMRHRARLRDGLRVGGCGAV